MTSPSTASPARKKVRPQLPINKLCFWRPHTILSSSSRSNLLLSNKNYLKSLPQANTNTTDKSLHVYNIEPTRISNKDIETYCDASIYDIHFKESMMNQNYYHSTSTVTKSIEHSEYSIHGVDSPSSILSHHLSSSTPIPAIRENSISKSNMVCQDTNDTIIITENENKEITEANTRETSQRSLCRTNIAQQYQQNYISKQNSSCDYPTDEIKQILNKSIGKEKSKMVSKINKIQLPSEANETGPPRSNLDNLVDEEEIYVDILTNDDDNINPLVGSEASVLLRLQCQTDFEKELEQSGKVLTRHKLVYENEEMHRTAINGLAKLFNRDFHKQHQKPEIIATTNMLSSPSPSSHSSSLSISPGSPLVPTAFELSLPGKCIRASDSTTSSVADTVLPPGNSKPSYFGDLQDCQRQTTSSPEVLFITEQNPYPLSAMLKSSFPVGNVCHDRKRIKLRKNIRLDEETISPVSGTIIRKLRDDEQLVVRKGDIDPAFNVVEVTEEAKAVLASIDNKIGDYLCQLCRTLYDDAFQLAQHRCPRIVHLEYKCSECEKVLFE